MATNFPSSLDALSNPSSGDALNNVTTPHASQHANINDAVEALQAKVGVDSSTVTSSMDYKLARLSGINVVVNGDLAVWQSGTGAFSSAGVYTADQAVMTFGSSTLSVSQQALAAGSPFNFAARCTTTTSSNASGFALLQFLVEDVSTLAGEIATLSFYAAATASGKFVSTELFQSFGSGGSSSVNTIGVTKHALTTSLARYQCTFTIPSVSGKTIGTGSYLNIIFWLEGGSTFNARTGSLGNQSSVIDITGVQLERGATATPFEYVNPQTQLARCQRYFWRQGGVATDNFGYGQVNATNTCVAYIRFPTTMRVVPSLTATGAGNFVINDVSVAPSVSSIALDGGTSSTRDGASVLFTASASTLTVGRAARVYATSSGYLDYNARLT